MNDKIKTISGYFEVSPDGRFGFIRSGNPKKAFECKDDKGATIAWEASPDDIYVSEDQIKDYNTKEGDIIECTAKPAVGNERFSTAVILKINGNPI